MINLKKRGDGFVSIPLHSHCYNEINNHKAQETTTMPILEVRLGDLDKTLKEYMLKE